MKKLALPSMVAQGNIHRTLKVGDDTRKLCRTIGNVTYVIIDKSQTVKFILEKQIKSEIAQKLANLEMTANLFTFEIYADAAIIPNFADAASLDEIFAVRSSWPFQSEHSLILSKDVSACLTLQ